MSFDFMLPVSRDDLLQKTGVNQYVVDEVLSIRNLPSKLKECQMAYRSGGPITMLNHFDTFFSVIVHFNGVDLDLKENTWQLILKYVQGLGGTLPDFVERQNVTSDQRLEQVNALKMSVYLMCQFIDRCEQSAIKPSNTIVTAGRGKKKVLKSTSSTSPDSIEMMSNWDSERERAVTALLQIFQLGISRLWDPPIVEEEFVNMVTNTCYKLLEVPSVVKSKSIRDAIFHLLGISVKRYNHSMGPSSSKSIRDAIFHLLGISVKRFNHSTGCTLKLLQLLQQNEQLAQPCASAVQLFVDSYGVKSIVSEIMREIGRMDSKEFSRDSASARAYAGFLLEISRLVPASVLPNISMVLMLLDGESYTMRNCVLGVIAELVVRLLSCETLDQKQKSTRNQFLDKLEDHIHDVNAFVRSKVLQLWLYIVNEKALPIQRQQALLELAVGRLKDKSSVVRKSAVQLVAALIRMNLLAARFTVEELKTNHDKESAKLKEMMASMPAPANNSNDGDAVTLLTITAEWEKLESGLRKYLNKNSKTASKEKDDDEVDDDDDEDDDDDDDENVGIEKEETLEEVKSRILSMMQAGSFSGAVSLLKLARENWPLDASQGKGDAPDAPLGEEEGEEGQVTIDTEALVQNLKEIFVGNVLVPEISRVMEPQEDKQTPEGEAITAVSKQVLVQYLKDAMDFMTEIKNAVGVVGQLLNSKTSSDVLESIDFFVSGVEVGMGYSYLGVRRMLPLVWSKETSIRDAVLDAYKKVYLNCEATGNNQRAQAVSIANALITLTSGVTLGDLASLDELIRQFVKSGDLSKKVVQVLWEKFSLKLPNTTVQESRGALVLLSMVAGAEPETVKSNIPTLISEGLGSRAEDDFLLARHTCHAFSKLANQPKELSKSQKVFRLAKDHELFNRLSHLLVTGFLIPDALPDSSSSLTSSLQDDSNLTSNFRTRDDSWIPMAEEAISLIYKIAESPDVICAEIIKAQAASIIGSVGKRNPEPTDSSVLDMIDSEELLSSTNQNEESSTDPKTSQSQSSFSLCPASLTRFLYVCGHVAFNQLIHLDVAVFGELKRRHAAQELKSSGSSTGAARKSGAASVAASAMKQSKEGDDEEMGLAGATAEDAEAEYIRKIAEKEVVTGGANLLSVLSPLVINVCTNQSRFTDSNLRTSAALALAKYMIVSSEFCEAHLPLLFTLLEKSPEPSVRANTIIALGDLTMRFPNLVEPWTSNIYARLRDSSLLVRKNTLIVLRHLILRDMIKVKGQISELAVCVIDSDAQISSCAKTFFNELSKKGNAIYNILPDVISRLSDAEVGIDEENFHIVLKYLMSFIQKDRQSESLVEKLCLRFRATSIERQWRDLAFCLSLLQYSEKSIRKLQENFSSFGDKLTEDEVYESFLSIVAAARKFCKPEAKVLLDEFEQRLTEARTKGVDEDTAANNAATAAAGASSAKKLPAKKNSGRAQKGGRKKLDLTSSEDDVSISDDDDDDNVDDDDAPASKQAAAAGPRKTTSRTAAAKQKKIAFDLSSDEGEFHTTNRAAKRGAGGGATKRMVNSDSSDENDSPPPSVIKKKSVCSKSSGRERK